MYDVTFLIPDYDDSELIWRLPACQRDEMPTSERERQDSETDALHESGAFDPDNELPM